MKKVDVYVVVESTGTKGVRNLFCRTRQEIDGLKRGVLLVSCE